MNERLVWIDCEMTGLDLRADALIEVAALVTDFDLNVLGEGIDLIVQAARRGAGADGRLRPEHAREVRPARGAGVRHHARGGRGAGAHLPQVPVRPPGPSAARRQLGGHRPGVHQPRHARPRAVPALPDRRRLLDQGAVPTLVPAGLLPVARQARQPPGTRRHPGEHRGAALLPRGGLRPLPRPRLRRRPCHRPPPRRRAHRPRRQTPSPMRKSRLPGLHSCAVPGTPGPTWWV